MPEQKLRIIKELQKRDSIVGMTGDGVNDAPSLEAADIGIAFGSEFDIAIEASGMVLLDFFSLIAEAVLYGHVVFNSLKKTVIYLLPAGMFSEFWPIMTNVIFGLPQILSSFLMVAICCFTGCATATALAYERPEVDVMLRPPRNPKKDKLPTRFLSFEEIITSLAMAYWYAQRRGDPLGKLWFGYSSLPSEEFVMSVVNEASSFYFVNLVILQCFNLMSTFAKSLELDARTGRAFTSANGVWHFYTLFKRGTEMGCKKVAKWHHCKAGMVVLAYKEGAGLVKGTDTLQT
ncbi:MAG: hypothetical protein LQ347_002213 [Umbilicaria vellea]|nr:MAG: hypothetical protein LQ347_002213 [Umbilicaria vellea]